MRVNKSTTIRISIATRDTLNEIKEELVASTGWSLKRNPPSYDSVLTLLFNRYKDEDTDDVTR